MIYLLNRINVNTFLLNNKEKYTEFKYQFNDNDCQKYLQNPTLTNHKILFPSLFKLVPNKINDDKLFYNTNPFLHSIAYAPYSCECSDKYFCNKTTHDVFMKNKCPLIETKNVKKNNKTSLIAYYESTLHGMETFDDYFDCHTIHYDRCNKIVLISNYILFKCQLCLETKNSINSLIQPCGHCLCSQCAIKMLDYTNEPIKKKNMLYKCIVCRSELDNKLMGPIIVN